MKNNRRNRFGGRLKISCKNKGGGGVILIGAKPSFLLVMDGFCSYNTVYLRSLSHEMLIFLLTVFDT